MNRVEAVVRAWTASCEEVGVPLVAPAPLLRPDPTVLLVNAGITPFKPAMLRGEILAPAAVVQPCVRTYWNTPGRFAFDMLTMVAMMEEAPRAARLAAALAVRLGLDRSHLRCVVDRRDEDVAALAAHLCAPEAIEWQDGNSDLYWTRWRFGEGDALVGRGLTLVHAEAGTRLSLGNLILVDHPPSGRTYVDLGFGVERLASVPYSGDEWAADPLAPAIAALVAEGSNEAHARDLANRAVAMARMIGAGALPDARGAGYLLRKLIRSTVDLAVEAAVDEPPERAVDRMLADIRPFIDEPAVHAVAASEAQHYLAQVARSGRMLMQRTKRTGTTLDLLDPAGTYGLPGWAVARLSRD